MIAVIIGIVLVTDGVDTDGRCFNLGKVATQIADDIREHYPNAALIEVDTRLHDIILDIDPSLFMLAARNLMENAALHSPADSTVRCGVKIGEDGVAVTINDNGPGIPEDELSKVCERFYRGRNTTAMGSGLGLAIAELAAKRLGGSLSLKNRPEGGFSAELRFLRSAFNSAQLPAPS